MSEYPPHEPAGTMDMSACAFCGQARARHEQMEADGEVQHVWAADRSQPPVQVDRGGKSPASPAQVIVAPAPDILLRQMLRDLGVITPDQYKALFGG